MDNCYCESLGSLILLYLILYKTHENFFIPINQSRLHLKSLKYKHKV